MAAQSLTEILPLLIGLLGRGGTLGETGLGRRFALEDDGGEYQQTATAGSACRQLPRSG